MTQIFKHEKKKAGNRLYAEFQCICNDKRCELVPGLQLNHIIEMDCNNGSFYTNEYLDRKPGRKELQLRIDGVIHTLYLKRMHCGNCGTVWYYAWTPDNFIIHTEYENIHTKQIA